jgi:tripartite-type tricarboxylate transporter receptor subunit TctC
MRANAASLGLVAAALAAAGATAAQEYPSRPLRVIVSFAPGGATDVIARTLAQKLTESLGQTVVVDNRAGAGANIGIGLAAKAPADGYTVLASSSAFAVNPSLYARVPYDPDKDFQPLTCVGDSPNILTVHPSVPAKTVKDLIELVRSQPGKHNSASPGTGTTPHLSGEILRLAIKLDMSHIPYGGAGPALQALVSGQVPIGLASVPSFAPQVKAGTLRGLAVTGANRSPALPDVPTMAESGITGMEANTFQGLFLPAGTPKAIVSRLHGEIVKALALPDVRERLGAIGLELVGNRPEEFAAQIKADIAKWRKVIREVNIRAE